MATKATELGQLARLLTIDSNGVTISGTLSATTLSGNGAGLTGVTSYTDSDFFGDLVLDSARTIVRGYFSAGGDAAYDSATGRITVNVPEGYTDSDTLSYLTTNTYATQSYVTGAVNAVIDAAPGAMDTLNELAAALNDDPNAFNTLQTLINANLDSADAVLLIDSDYVRQRAAKFVHDTYRFTATSGQTTFSGSDTASKTLDYTQSNLFVQLNGVNLVDNADFTATNGTSIVLDQGADSGDDLVITAFNHFDTTFAQAFEYTHRFVATTGQTDFSGSDVDGNVLIFNAQGTIVSLNGLTLQPTIDYTASNGTNVVLVTSADSADELLVRSFAKLEVADTVSATNGGTFTGPITVNGAFTSLGIDDNATSTAMTLNSSGNVGIGTSSPIRQLSLQNASNAEISILSGTSSNCSILMGDGTTGADVYRGYLQYNNATDTMLLRSVGPTTIEASGGLRLRIDGDGIKFNGDTAAANALDDYEEGSGTPVVGASVSGTVTIGANPRSEYTKIGNQVHFQFEFQVTATGSGAIKVTLPFTAYGYAAGSLRTYNVTFPGTSPFIETVPSHGVCYFYSNSSGNTTQQIMSTGYYYGEITYTTSA